MASPSSAATTPAPVWGPAISIAALVAANLVALLLNPGLLRSCCGSCWARRRRRLGEGATAAKPAAAAVGANDAAPAFSTRPPRRCRCTPAPFFASNMNEEAAERARCRTPPLPREFWGFDVLSPLDPLSSWLSPRSVRGHPHAAGPDVEAAAAAADAWAPATWLLLPLYTLVSVYFVVYVLLETLWSLPLPGPPDNPYPQWLSYLTNWSITLLGVAGILGAANTLRCCCRRGRHNHHSTAATPPAPRWDALSVAYLLVTEVAVTAALFVTIFFWGGVVGLGGGAGGLGATSYIAHAGNSGVAVLLILLTRIPVASPHFLALLWYASAYILFAVIYGSASGGDWRYGLDWQKAGPAIAYVLVPIFCFFVFFCVAFGLASAREGIGRRCVRPAGAARKEEGVGGAQV